MKPILTVLLLLVATSAASAVTDEGTVTWLDGKGVFEVKTERNGILVLHADAKLMAKELEFKPGYWPHLYKDIKPRDYISFRWHRDEKTGKNIATAVGVKKRGG